MPAEVPRPVFAHVMLSTSHGGLHWSLDGVEVTNWRESSRRVEADLDGSGGRIEVVTNNGRLDFRAR